MTGRRRLGNCRADANRRRGAVLVEAAIVIGILFTALFGMLDLGLFVLHQHCLAEGVRLVAREVIVHGEKAEPHAEEWGPDAVSITAADNSDIAAAMRPLLVAMEPSDVSISVTWPDGTNQVGKQVRVSVTYDHQMMFPFVLGDGTIPLEAVATMQIAH